MRGPIICLLAVFLLALMDVSVKWLVNGYSVPQIMLFRALFAFAPLILLAKIEKTPIRDISLKTDTFFIQLLRGLTVAIAVGTFFGALKFMPLADVVGVSLMGPAFATLLAYWLLGETFQPRVLIYIGIGMIGVLMIVQPGGDISLIGGILAFVSACFYAVSAILTRVLTKTDTTLVTSLYTNLALIVLSGAWLIGGKWTPFTITDIFVCLLMGVAGGGSNILFVVAFKLSEVSRIAILDYTIYFWTALFGVLFFHEIPTWFTLFGALLIIGAGYFVSTTKASR